VRCSDGYVHLKWRAPEHLRLAFHHLHYRTGKKTSVHQNTYVNNLAGFIEKDSNLQNKSLEQIMKEAYNGGNYGKVYNNAAQVWNHEVRNSHCCALSLGLLSLQLIVCR
jgi:superoxide dismutase